LFDLLGAAHQKDPRAHRHRPAGYLDAQVGHTAAALHMAMPVAALADAP
jgi:hypothetical protein